MKSLLTIIFMLTFMLGSQVAKGQRVLFLEKMTEVKSTKFYEGQQIQVKLKNEPDEWYTITLQQLMESEEVILFENGMIKLENISHVRIQRNWAVALSFGLKTFAAGTVIYGAIALAGSNPPTVIGVLGTAVGSYVLGWLIKKAWQYKIYKIGKKNRLRIIDLTLPVQERVIRP